MTIALDPVVRGPLFSALFMASSSAMLGCIVVCKKQALIGETFSHASYPGFILGAILAQIWLPFDSLWFSLAPFVGAFLCTILSKYLVDHLILRGTSEDSAQTAILSSLFAVGLLLLSSVQSVFPFLSRNMQALLLGQAATMSDVYIYVSASLFFAVVLCVFFLYRGYIVSLFDKDYAHLASLSQGWSRFVTDGLLIFCIMIGLRSMGVVLMTALLVFPAVCARLLARSFASMLLIATGIGAIAAAVGVSFAHTRFVPTGPLITLTLGSIFCLVLLFSPQMGFVMQAMRKWRFLRRCLLENALKIIWKTAQEKHCETFLRSQLLEACAVHKMTLKMLLRRLVSMGYIVLDKDVIVATPLGLRVGQRLVRLHRLWEVYLVECCRIPKERVHPTADEMEHIFSEDLERQLTSLLKNPTMDPHDRPIPVVEEVVP